jgi:hypothetical protein
LCATVRQSPDNVQAKAPRLDIKKDNKGMVVVPGATVLEVTSAKELMAQITAGQTHRHVASTQVGGLLLPLQTLDEFPCRRDS